MLCQSAYEHILYHLCHGYNEPMQYPANQMQAAPCYQDVEYRRSNQVITRHIPQVCPWAHSLLLPMRYGASQCGTACDIFISKHAIFCTIFYIRWACDITRLQYKKHKRLTNTATMVVELPGLPAAWIQWIQAAWGAGGLVHVCCKAAAKGFWYIPNINIEINIFLSTSRILI